MMNYIIPITCLLLVIIQGVAMSLRQYGLATFFAMLTIIIDAIFMIIIILSH